MGTIFSVLLEDDMLVHENSICIEDSTVQNLLNMVLFTPRNQLRQVTEQFLSTLW